MRAETIPPPPTGLLPCCPITPEPLVAATALFGRSEVKGDQPAAPLEETGC